MRSSPRRVGWWWGLLVITLLAVVCSGCVFFNGRPVISDMKAERDRVRVSGRSQFECVAADPDGDSLTYSWSATGGTFSWVGPVANWRAPDAPGIYTITVTVVDSRGAEATAQLSVDVIANRLPVIEQLTAEPATVKQGTSSTIRCIASDPDGDELSYQWQASGGSISGQGSIIDWTAPGTCGDYVVTVILTDGSGEVSEGIEIEVIKAG